MLSIFPFFASFINLSGIITANDKLRLCGKPCLYLASIINY